MSKTFWHTICVSALLACGALVTACQPSSDKDQSGRKSSSVKSAKETAPSKGEHTQAPTVFSPSAESAAPPPSERATQQRSVASTKATHAKAKAHAKAKTASKKAGKPSNTAKSGYTSYSDIPK